MNLVEASYLTSVEKEIVIALWNQEYPEKLHHNNIDDLDNYLGNLSETTHYLLKNDTGNIEGWAITFKRDDDRWFAVILNSRVQGKGNGTFLLNVLKEKEARLNGWVIDQDNAIKQNGEPYKSPLAFYIKNDFIVHPEIRFESEKMSAVKISWERK